MSVGARFDIAVATGSSSSYPPLRVATPDTFTVPDNSQVLFAVSIRVDGIIKIEGDGVFRQVI